MSETSVMPAMPWAPSLGVRTGSAKRGVLGFPERSRDVPNNGGARRRRPRECLREREACDEDRAARVKTDALRISAKKSFDRRAHGILARVLARDRPGRNQSVLSPVVSGRSSRRPELLRERPGGNLLWRHLLRGDLGILPS